MSKWSQISITIKCSNCLFYSKLHSECGRKHYALVALGLSKYQLYYSICTFQFSKDGFTIVVVFTILCVMYKYTKPYRMFRINCKRDFCGVSSKELDLFHLNPIVPNEREGNDCCWVDAFTFLHIIFIVCYRRRRRCCKQSTEMRNWKYIILFLRFSENENGCAFSHFYSHCWTVLYCVWYGFSYARHCNNQIARNHIFYFLRVMTHGLTESFHLKLYISDLNSIGRLFHTNNSTSTIQVVFNWTIKKSCNFTTLYAYI